METKQFYITFGQIHVHSYNNITLDKDTIGVINAENMQEARDFAFEHFDRKFFTVYPKDSWKKEWTPFYKKGFIELN